MQPLAYVTRGPITECIHFGDIAVCDAGGALLGAVGDPQRAIYWRSAAKPIQALSVVQSGAADRFAFTAKELAICCASHHGSADHVATVRGILAKIGLDEDALQCGTHWPGDGPEFARLHREGLQPSKLHNNCSGKHAGMLSTAVALGADPATYLDLCHPVQQAILANMSALSGLAVADIVIGTDGCGAPVHGMPLQRMATAFARLCAPDDMPRPIQAAAPRIIAAMAAEPVMIAGEGSFNTDLLDAYEARVVAKGGAEGLFVLGLTEHGIGLAVRVIDGSARAHPPIIMEALAQLGMVDDRVLPKLGRHLRIENRNCRDEVVGVIEAAGWTLTG